MRSSPARCWPGATSCSARPMEGLFRAGWVAALLLLVLAAEAAWLVARHRARRGGLPPGDALRLVLPGIGFVIALQAALASAAWWWVSLGLLLAGAAHLADLRARLRR